LFLHRSRFAQDDFLEFATATPAVAVAAATTSTVESIAAIDSFDDFSPTRVPAAQAADAAPLEKKSKKSKVASAPAPKRDGFLYKVGSGFKTWKQRWCIANGPTFSYYKDPKVCAFGARPDACIFTCVTSY
jgi:hypothetical protein